MSNVEQIKKLRDLTGAGVVDIKKALDEAAGDEGKALELLKKRGQEKAAKKLERTAQEGLVVSYVHGSGKVGAMLKLLCETDFVARNDEFKALATDIAMQIVAMNPKFVHPEEVDEDLVNKEKEIWKEQLLSEGKPAEMLEKILSGKEKKFREELALLTQAFVKDPEKTVGDVVSEKIGKIGENIQVGEFIRFEI